MTLPSRIQWIDTAKGIGIILMIYGHIQPRTAEVDFLYTFHLPLFFFISGFLFNNASSRTWLDMLSAKAKSLLFPYIFFGIIGIAYQYALSMFDFQHLFADGQSLSSMSFGLLFGIRGTSAINGTVWFLPCLFLVEAFYIFILCFLRLNLSYTVVSSGLVLLLGIHLHRNYISLKAYSLDVALITQAFFIAGYALKSLTYINSRLNSNILFPIFFTLVTIFCSLRNPNSVDMYSSSYGSFPLFILGGLSGALATMLWSQKLFFSRTLSFIGINSIGFLLLHQCFLYRFSTFISQYIFSPFTDLKLPLRFESVITLLICMLLNSFVILFIRSYIPSILGYREPSVKMSS